MKTIIIFSILFLSGCNFTSSIKLPEEENLLFEKPGKPIKEYFVKNFIQLNENLNSIPDKQVTIVLNQPVSLQDFIQILISQGFNLIADCKTEIQLSIPRFEGDIKDLLRSLQYSHGLFCQYKNNVLVIKEKVPCYIKVLMPDMQDQLIKLVESFGIEKIHYDELSSRIVFQTDFFIYQELKSYFEKNPYLSLVVFDVMVLENEESSEYKNGIDWHKLAVSLQELSNPFSMTLTGSADDGSFALKANSKFSLQQVFYNLSKKSKFRVLQSARISTLNGSECLLDVSDKIPYVQKITVGNLSDEDGTTVQGYDFATANNGLVLKIRPSVSDDIISLKFQADITSLVDFLEVGNSQNLTKQPIMALRSILNQLILNPGETFLIGGLRYRKGSLVSGGLTFQDGYQLDDSRSFSISVLIRSELLRYVFI